MWASISGSSSDAERKSHFIFYPGSSGSSFVLPSLPRLHPFWSTPVKLQKVTLIPAEPTNHDQDCFTGVHISPTLDHFDEKTHVKSMKLICYGGLLLAKSCSFPLFLYLTTGLSVIFTTWALKNLEPTRNNVQTWNNAVYHYTNPDLFQVLIPTFGLEYFHSSERFDAQRDFRLQINPSQVSPSFCLESEHYKTCFIVRSVKKNRLTAEQVFEKGYFCLLDLISDQSARLLWDWLKKMMSTLQTVLTV